MGKNVDSKKWKTDLQFSKDGIIQDQFIVSQIVEKNKDFMMNITFTWIVNLFPNRVRVSLPKR